MRILIVKLSAIGDCIHTLPAVAYLKRALPDAHIAWAVEPKAGALLQGSPVIDALIEVDAQALRHLMFGSATLADLQTSIQASRPASRSQYFDVAIDFQGLLKSGLVASASKAPRRVGFESADLREKLSRIFLTEEVQTSSIAHVIEKNLALARAVTGSTIANNSMIDYEFPIAISPEDEKQVIEIGVSRYAILNPGGGWATKLWAAKNFGAVADWLWENHQLTSLVTFGPGEAPLAQTVAKSSHTEKAIPFPSTLKQFAALARGAAIFIGGDTGPLHLAAACCTPIVGLYGPTSPERNGPFDKNDRVVQLDLWCREKCHRRKCWHWQCMDMSVERVCHEVSNRLKSGSPDNRSTQHPVAFNV